MYRCSMPIQPVSHRVATPIGTLVLEGDERGLRAAFFHEEPAASAACPAALRPYVDSVEDYFAGKKRFGGIALAMVGTDFQQRVWDAAAGIPWGSTVTYGELAAAVGTPGASRAVGTALARNPIALLVPCHRIITSDGACGGYAWGTWRKQWLLRHESAS